MIGTPEQQRLVAAVAALRDNDVDSGAMAGTYLFIGNGLEKHHVPIEIWAKSRDELIVALTREITSRDADPEKCLGLHGWTEQSTILGFAGVQWAHDRRLGDRVAVIWHPAAIIPPAFVMAPRFIVYGAVD